MNPAIRAASLSVRIGSKRIIKDFNVSIPPGYIVGLLGPSGAGKTTLIKSLVGLRKVDGGSLDIFGIAAGSDDLRKIIGYMPQTTSLYPDLTAKENIKYFASLSGLHSVDPVKSLTAVKMQSSANKQVSKLSGGQKARVSLAVALLGRPKLLVLDEPTVGVDPVLRLELWEHFRNLAAGGTSIIVTSHVMDEAERCDYLMLIKDGKLLAFDLPSKLKHHTRTHTVEQTFIKLEERK